jgi:hypothetical protein
MVATKIYNMAYIIVDFVLFMKNFYPNFIVSNDEDEILEYLYSKEYKKFFKKNFDLDIVPVFHDNKNYREKTSRIVIGIIINTFNIKDTSLNEQKDLNTEMLVKILEQTNNKLTNMKLEFGEIKFGFVPNDCWCCS